MAHRSAPWVVVLALALAGCGPEPAPPPSPEGNALVVVVRPGPTTWFAGPNGAPSGLDHDLLERFAREQKLALVVVVADNATTLMSKVSRGEGLVRRDGDAPFPIGLSTTTFQQAAQEAPSVTAIFTDISDSKQLQELRLRAERLEAVAALSASLAHEIRNPLASIRSSVEQLASSAAEGDDEQVLARLIVRESDRLSRLLSEFLDFSRVRATRAEPVDLHLVATAAMRLVAQHPECGPAAQLLVEGGPTLLEGDEDLLHRVIANLVLNAVQAAHGEPVRVTVKLDTSSEVPAGAGFERAVRLEVRDDGPGIPEEIRERLFEPFVSGRPGGSGLGRANVQRAVEAHRGFVLVESAPGAGTTFTIYLPATWMAEDAA